MPQPIASTPELVNKLKDALTSDGVVALRQVCKFLATDPEWRQEASAVEHLLTRLGWSAENAKASNLA